MVPGGAMTMQNILVIEDLPASQAWLAGMLRQAFPAADIHAAGTLAEAGSIAERINPDLALVDLNLPDGSGCGFIRKLKSACPDCICVVSTIFSDDDHLFSALHAGASGYLLKDRPSAEQLACLRQLIGGLPAVSPPIVTRLMDSFHAPASATPPTELTDREAEILGLISKGYTVSEAGVSLDISRNTVSTHVKSIYRKLKISSRAEATPEAIRLGLLTRQA